MMSANSALIVLRSPSGASLTSCAALKLARSDPPRVDGPAVTLSLLPHCLQKLASEGFSVPHFAQRPNGFPQPTQNLASSGLSREHLRQRIVVARPPHHASLKLVSSRFAKGA